MRAEPVYECLIEIADVPVRIRCRHQVNIDFFRDYRTEKPERYVIEPAEEDLTRMRAELGWKNDVKGLPRAESFLENNTIHLLLAERLVQENVLLMHGSALCMDGQAYIFTARSGTGKSTHTRLWREAFGDRVWMINDDKPMLRIEDSGVRVYGTPWNGKHRLSRNASAPLRAVVNLERDTFNHVEPLPKADAFQVLMKQVFGFRDPASAARVMELEIRLLGMTDFLLLGCNTEPDAAKTVWEEMNRLLPARAESPAERK